MEQHPIPRQITTFEFKLIGFMTVKQFIYLIVFVPLGIIVFYLFPIPILNFIFAVLVGFLGVALAFLPIYDRPLDVWILNLYKRLTSPTQYFYKKDVAPLYFLEDIKITNPLYVQNYIQSQQYLNQYLQKKSPQSLKNTKKQQINQFFNLPFNKPRQKKEEVINTPSSASLSPFLTGIVKNYKLLPLPGILIYIKNQEGETIRLLKSNPNGVFATFKPLLPGEYTLEARDPKNTYNFDTMKIKIENEKPKPIEIFSKELL